MNSRGGALLVGLLLLSLFVAGFIGGMLHRPLRPLPGLPFMNPAYDGPPPPTFHPFLRKGPSPFPPSRPAAPLIRRRLPVRLPWTRPLLLRPRPIWQVGRVLAAEIFFFLVASIVILTFPRRFARCIRIFLKDNSTWLPLAVGFSSSITISILVILAALSGWGLILLLWLLLLLGFVWVTGLSLAALYTGYRVRQSFHISNAPWPLDLAIGVLILITVGIVPVIGWMAFFIAGMWGMGVVILTRFGSERGWDLDVTFEDNVNV